MSFSRMQNAFTIIRSSNNYEWMLQWLSWHNHQLSWDGIHDMQRHLSHLSHDAHTMGAVRTPATCCSAGMTSGAVSLPQQSRSLFTDIVGQHITEPPLSLEVSEEPQSFVQATPVYFRRFCPFLRKLPTWSMPVIEHWLVIEHRD